MGRKWGQSYSGGGYKNEYTDWEDGNIPVVAHCFDRIDSSALPFALRPGLSEKFG